MSEPYSRALQALAEQVAKQQGLTLPRAVFVAVPGPNLETAAEYRFLRGIGADVVGMSLVPENLVAIHGGQRVLASPWSPTNVNPTTFVRWTSRRSWRWPREPRPR
jgi:purine nucleoside phosphorylase